MFNFILSIFKKPSLHAIIQNGVVVIDVRSEQEYKQGHLKGAKNIPLNVIKSQVDSIKKWNKPVITVCQSGNRSQVAKSILKANNVEAYNGGGWLGFKNKYNL